MQLTNAPHLNPNPQNFVSSANPKTHCLAEVVPTLAQSWRHYGRTFVRNEHWINGFIKKRRGKSLEKYTFSPSLNTRLFWKLIKTKT